MRVKYKYEGGISVKRLVVVLTVVALLWCTGVVVLASDDLQQLMEQKRELHEELVALSEKIQFLQLEKLKASASPDESPDVLWEMASEYGKMQRIDRAVAYYKQFAEDYPQHELAPKAYIMIASLRIFEQYFLTGGNVNVEDKDMDFSEAIHALQTVIDKYPLSEYADDAGFGIALTYLLNANRLAVLREAGMQMTRDYRESLERNREGLMKSLELHKRLLAIYEELVSDQDVVTWSGASYSTVLSNANVQYNIALIYDLVMDWDNALREYEAYLAMNPQGARAIKARARVRMIQEGGMPGQ